MKYISRSMCFYKKEQEYESISNYDTSEYSFIMKRYNNYHPPNADPKDPPPPAFAAIGSKDSMLGVAAPTKGVESC